MVEVWVGFGQAPPQMTQEAAQAPNVEEEVSTNQNQEHF